MAPKATITAEKAGISQNLIRYYNGNNNLGDGHSNYTKSWKDLAGKKMVQLKEMQILQTKVV